MCHPPLVWGNRLFEKHHQNPLSCRILNCKIKFTKAMMI
jgi:hypothetical protein